MGVKRLALMVALLVGCVQAQFIGYTSQQSTTSTPINNLTCTAALAAGTVSVSNIGQGAHFLTAIPGVSPPSSFAYVMQGSYDGSLFFDISDVGTGPVNGSDITSVAGSGYYPAVGVKVLSCVPGAATISLRYSGISLTPGQPVGAAQHGQITKHIASGAGAGTTFVTPALRSPFGSSAGTLAFVYGGVGPANSTLQINCNTNILGSGPVVFGPASLQTTSGFFQIFQIPPFACPWFTVSYTSGGASGSTYTLDYSFAEPGVGPAAFQYTHVAGTTATVVKGTAPAFLHTLTVNTGVASTISIFDLATAACTGTPATNTVAVITTTTAALTFTYDTNFLNGICVKAANAMDYTVSAQ